MLDHVDPKSFNTLPSAVLSIDWEALARHSSAYAIGATTLSVRLALIQDRLRNLPGMFECGIRVGDREGFIQWRRVSGEWTFWIWRNDDSTYVVLSQMRVEEKAMLATGLRSLLLHMFEESKKRADIVALGLNKLDKVEALINGIKEGE